MVWVLPWSTPPGFSFLSVSPKSGKDCESQQARQFKSVCPFRQEAFLWAQTTFCQNSLATSKLVLPLVNWGSNLPQAGAWTLKGCGRQPFCISLCTGRMLCWVLWHNCSDTQSTPHYSQQWCGEGSRFLWVAVSGLSSPVTHLLHSCALPVPVHSVFTLHQPGFLSL